MSRKDETVWIREGGDRGKWRDAERARLNRREIQHALSSGEVSRRDLVKWGLFTGAGLLAPIGGLSPFAHAQIAATASSPSSSGQNGTGVPTGLPASPTFGVAPFSSPLYRFDILPQFYVPGSAAAQHPVPSIPQSTTALNPTPTAQANTTQQTLDPALVNGTTGLTGPIEGRPPGPVWAHQQFSQLPPQVQIDIVTEDARADTTYHPGVASNFNSGINQASTIPFAFNPNFPVQTNNSMWAFNGTLPPKLIVARYGTPILFREHNDLPADVTANGVNGFGRHTLTTHEHNGHHGAENDGFTGAYFFPNQFYDYHYPWTLAGWTSINTNATDRHAGAPDGNGGITKVPGDWHETMSSHWFHDHMFTFTDQNVYKGLAGMTNIYSSLDRGNEGLNDGINLRLPSGSLQDFANLQYDINLMFVDKAWDSNGQLDMDTLQLNGFLGDQMTVNHCWKPFLQVYSRKYRFRLLNGAVSRFFVFALSDASGNAVPGQVMTYIANDGNLLPAPVPAPNNQLDQLGIAERYDIIIDFTSFSAGTKLYLVNLQEQTLPQLPGPIQTLPGAFGGDANDPAVGPCLQFQILGPPPTPDVSVIPATMIPNPTRPAVNNTRTFIFGQKGMVTTDDPVSTFFTNGTSGTGGLPFWGIETQNDSAVPGNTCTVTNKQLGNGNDDANCQLMADFGRVSSAPTSGTSEVWTLKNGAGWDHPIHIHFEEGTILSRSVGGTSVPVPAWEQGRKDVYRLRPGGTLTLIMQFRDWGGMFMEHCHNMMHEDNAMLLRWEINAAGGVFLNPLPTPIPAPTGVTFQTPDEVLAGAFPPYSSTSNGSATGQ
jgi:FtsP/CotA-like multicopper oxidase with cupredoxin domain